MTDMTEVGGRVMDDNDGLDVTVINYVTRSAVAGDSCGVICGMLIHDYNVTFCNIVTRWSRILCNKNILLIPTEIGGCLL